MVGVASWNLQVDPQPGSFGRGWGLAAAWHRSIFIIWTGWALEVASHDDSTINITIRIIIITTIIIIIWTFIHQMMVANNKQRKMKRKWNYICYLDSEVHHCGYNNLDTQSTDHKI